MSYTYSGVLNICTNDFIHRHIKCVTSHASVKNIPFGAAVRVEDGGS